MTLMRMAGCLIIRRPFILASDKFSPSIGYRRQVKLWSQPLRGQVLRDEMDADNSSTMSNIFLNIICFAIAIGSTSEKSLTK